MNRWSTVLVSDDEEDKAKRKSSKMNRWSTILVSDDEEDKAKTKSSKMNNWSAILVSDDEEEKKPTRKAMKRKITKEEYDLKPDKTADCDTPKKPTRKAMKRKITKEEYDLKPNKTADCDTTKSKKSRTREDSSDKENSKNSETFWKEHELIAENMNLNKHIVKNVIKLLSDGNTVPFISRYRREATDNMTPEVLREVKSAFEEISQLKQKITSVISTLQKSGNFTNNLEKAVKSSKSLEELEIIYAPFKPEGKRTLAERAKALGLEQPALELLFNSSTVNLNNYVNKSKEELNDLTNIETGIVHIIAQKIATDSEVLSLLRDLRKQLNCTIKTKKLKLKNTSNPKSQKKKTIGEKPVDESKFENYFEFQAPVRQIKPHQIMAINRGEHHKILSVKIVIPDFLSIKFHQFCFQKWVNHGFNNQHRRKILDDAIKDSYIRLVQPFIIREIRSELKTMAEKASYDVFSKNLKHLLLAAPVKGQAILGIDPGYSHGCKIAVISPMGTVLDHGVIYPHSNATKKEYGKQKLREMLQTYDCSLISIGDGTASKETEEWITELIKNKYFYPIDVKYTIVSEDGASIYSCNTEAKNEFGDLDTNIISAVSLARRVQDPMAELVKVEPKHLGVGMYQHDLKKKTLEEALDEVVTECVSFVGVDLNTASQALLRRIAGLSPKRASEIVKYRENNGPFISRKQLTEVSGIGPKVFQQCAGFLRVGPTEASSSKNFYKNPKTTKLDQTYIHPESYDIAQNLLKLLKLKSTDIGEPKFISQVKSAKINITQFQEKISELTLNLIVDALTKPLNYDFRSEISQTVFFYTRLKSMDDLRVGTKVMGRVKNVTHFGCFIDIGVGKDALIHSSKLGKFDLQVGDRMEGVVLMIDKSRQRINVEPTAKL